MKRLTVLFCAFVGIFQTAISYAGFGVHTGANWGLGSMGDKSLIADRTVNRGALQVLPGYRVMGVLVGPMAELNLMGQNTEAKDVSNTNLKGTGYMLGLGGQYQFMDFVFAGSVDFLGRHTLSKNTATGQKSYYTSPLGFRLLAGYQFHEMMSADVVYSYHMYDKVNLGGADRVLVGNDRLEVFTFAVGLSSRFDF